MSGGTVDGDLLGDLQAIIKEETLYLRHYMGKVVKTTDVSKLGRVQVTIPELGFETPDIGIWCHPRQGYGLLPPKIGDWVEVYFMNGDSSRPVYINGVSELADQIPTNYTGVPKDGVIFEDPNNPANNISIVGGIVLMTCGGLTGQVVNITATDQMVINGGKDIYISAPAGKIVLTGGVGGVSTIGGISPVVLGAPLLADLALLNAQIAALKLAIATWIPLAGDGGALLKIGLAAFLATPPPLFATCLGTSTVL